MDLNRATIIGRLTQDPEVKTTPSGKSVATLSVATNRVWSDQAGQKQEQVEFHSCVLWGKLADIAGQYLNKGRQAYFEGRIQTRDWAGQDGVKRYRTEIIVDNMIMLGGGKGGDSSGGGYSSNKSSSSSAPVDQNSGSDDEIKVEDIPF